MYLYVKNIFETKYLSPTNNRTGLLMHLNPISTILSESQKNFTASVPQVDNNQRKFRTPRKNLPEQMEPLSKLENGKINIFEDKYINTSLLAILDDEGFHLQKI